MLCAWQSFCTTSVHVLFGLPLGLEPSTSYSIHFFTQLASSFRNTCPYHCNLFCCSINIISSIPSLSLNSLLGTLSLTLTLHIHLTILISARWSAASFSFLTGQVSLPCSILLCTQLLYSLPVLIIDISLLVSNGTNCLGAFDLQLKRWGFNSQPFHFVSSLTSAFELLVMCDVLQIMFFLFYFCYAHPFFTFTVLIFMHSF